MVDFGPEMNGDWFPWNGAYGGGAAGARFYRDAFRHVVTLFRQRGVANVSFAFHIQPWSQPARPWNDPGRYYPGNKLEWGVVEAPARGDKTRWIERAFASLAERRFAAVRGISWWDERWENDDGSRSDLRIDSSPDALAAYRRGIAGSRYESAPRFTCIADG